MSTLADRLLKAMNAHDLDAFVDCFDPHYQSEQPLHPERGFSGSDQVRANWANMFARVPDFRAKVRTQATAGDGVEFAEWEWSGTASDGSPYIRKGVIVLGSREGRIVWARLYMEPVSQAK